MTKFAKKITAALIAAAVSISSMSILALADENPKERPFGVGTATLSVSGTKGTGTTTLNRSGGSVYVFTYGKYLPTNSDTTKDTGYGASGSTVASAAVVRPTSSYWVYVEGTYEGYYDNSYGSTSLKITLS